MSAVMASEECPSISCTTLMCSPAAMSAEAVLCLSVCRVTPVSSARSAIAAKARSAFRGSVGVPICVGNTKSSWPGHGCHTAAACCSAVSAVLCLAEGDYAAHLRKRGHRALVEAEEASRYGSTVWAHAPGRREMASGEPVRDGWLRFKLSDADYRLSSTLAAIVTVDRQAGQILGVNSLIRSRL
jgi:hypothetical protein